MKEVLRISQELDQLLNGFDKGLVDKEQLEAKRQELNQALEGG